MSETEELESLFDVKKILGEGAFGKVYECFDRENGMECAVKVILKDSLKKSKLTDTKEEAGILAKINHSNIVKHYDMK
jgi:serine/threonine protein kinase